MGSQDDGTYRRGPVSWAVFRLTGFVLLCLAASCATPGRSYRVTPAIAALSTARRFRWATLSFSLTVIHRENPSLFDRQVTSLHSDQRFHFEATQLVLAGQEYTKNYKVYLYLRHGQEDRVIWRTTLSRRALAGPIELDCCQLPNYLTQVTELFYCS